jgi:hypothetical protein
MKMNKEDSLGLYRKQNYLYKNVYLKLFYTNLIFVVIH